MVDPDSHLSAIRNTLQVAIDDLTLMTPLLAEMTSEAEEAETKLKNIDVTPSAFSSYPAAQSIASIHAAVAAVFTETTAGLVADTETFSQALRDTLTEWDRAESATSASFTALVSFANDYEMASQSNFDQGRDEHGDQLGREDEQTDAQAAAGEDSLEQDQQARQAEARLNANRPKFV